MKVFLRLVAVFLLSSVAFSQSDEIVPNENLVAEGIPNIPSSLAETVDRYNNFRGASLDSWDPVKREMLISTRFADTSQIHLVKMPGGARTQLTFYADRVAGAQYSPTKDDFFVLSKDIGGGEFFQFYRYDVATGDVTLLTDGKSRNTNPVWSIQATRSLTDPHAEPAMTLIFTSSIPPNPRATICWCSCKGEAGHLWIGPPTGRRFWRWIEFPSTKAMSGLSMSAAVKRLCSPRKAAT